MGSQQNKSGEIDNYVMRNRKSRSSGRKHQAIWFSKGQERVGMLRGLYLANTQDHFRVFARVQVVVHKLPLIAILVVAMCGAPTASNGEDEAKQSRLAFFETVVQLSTLANETRTEAQVTLANTDDPTVAMFFAWKHRDAIFSPEAGPLEFAAYIQGRVRSDIPPIWKKNLVCAYHRNAQERALFERISASLRLIRPEPKVADLNRGKVSFVRITGSDTLVTRQRCEFVASRELLRFNYADQMFSVPLAVFGDRNLNGRWITAICNNDSVVVVLHQGMGQTCIVYRLARNTNKRIWESHGWADLAPLRVGGLGDEFYEVRLLDNERIACFGSSSSECYADVFSFATGRPLAHFSTSGWQEFADEAPRRLQQLRETAKE